MCLLTPPEDLMPPHQLDSTFQRNKSTFIHPCERPSAISHGGRENVPEGSVVAMAKGWAVPVSAVSRCAAFLFKCMCPCLLQTQCQPKQYWHMDYPLLHFCAWWMYQMWVISETETPFFIRLSSKLLQFCMLSKVKPTGRNSGHINAVYPQNRQSLTASHFCSRPGERCTSGRGAEEMADATQD